MKHVARAGSKRVPSVGSEQCPRCTFEHCFTCPEMRQINSLLTGEYFAPVIAQHKGKSFTGLPRSKVSRVHTDAGVLLFPPARHRNAMHNPKDRVEDTPKTGNVCLN